MDVTPAGIGVHPTLVVHTEPMDDRSDEMRFAFGENWRRFLSLVDESAIQQSMASISEMLGVERLDGVRFLDVGSGSGLSSLAARRLGAEVRSFDFDPSSVACTMELRRRFAPDDQSWVIESGSALDRDFLDNLGTFDVVYSWGVLHHTGDMWSALDNMVDLVDSGGRLFIAIYNDPGPSTQVWTRVKATYNRSPRVARWILIAGTASWFAFRRLIKVPLRWTPDVNAPSSAPTSRGMNLWVDLVDWVGGFPYQAARPEEIFDFYTERGFQLSRMVTCGSNHGCNQFVLSKRT